MAIQPIRLPSARGGHAILPKTPKLPKVAISQGGRVAPRAPGAIRGTTIPKAPAPTAVDDAMAAYRQALAQLNASVAPVDAAAIRAPYTQAEATTGQLGAGYGQMVQQAGDAASAQYTQGLNEAQKAAAAFGISAGAGANATQLQNTGSAPLALQTQANTAAAAAAVPQWQNLLEHAATTKIADAITGRQNALDSAQASLAGTIPSLINNEKDRRFSAKTEKFNEGLAASQLTAKQNADLRSYELGAAKVQTSAATAKTNAQIKRASLAQKTSNDAANLRVKQDALALKKRAAQATATGLKGVAAATKALASTTRKAGSKKAAKGWDVTIQPWDTANNKPSGPVKTIHAARADFAPPGYKNVGNATTHYETVPTSAGSAGLTASTWDAQYRSLMAQNPGAAAAVKKFLGPRPKK